MAITEPTTAFDITEAIKKLEKIVYYFKMQTLFKNEKSVILTSKIIEPMNCKIKEERLKQDWIIEADLTSVKLK